MAQSIASLLMELLFHKTFKKLYQKHPKKIQDKFGERLELFTLNEQHPLLHLHTLSGAEYHIESINVTADYRALFLRTKKDITFLRIGTHSSLYGK